MLLYSIAEGTRSDASIVLDSNSGGTQLFDCTREELRPACQLGSFISRISGKPVSARRVDGMITGEKPERQDWGGSRVRSNQEASPEVITWAREANLIWSVEGDVMFPDSFQDDGIFVGRNTDPADRGSTHKGALQAVEQVFLL
ncbi:hypothetical protein QFC21_007243 [Naganishia friedmannii]|uniref:Uncharacterized protein n=1 Tax=Naganishia friedmannii TaxID=89922 RepID=A0ACC2UWY4_9TREE|nr:hypothetical protein QFC21_007243 [Naganishia friedmannii]